MAASAEQPFLDVFVQPSYGQAKCWLVYRIAAGYEDCGVYAARSSTGLDDSWENVNELPAATDQIIEDDEDWRGFMFNPVYYKLVLVRSSEEFWESPVVSSFGRLSKDEYYDVRAMLDNELLSMRVEGGIRMLHLAPSTRGTLGPNYDPDTLQKLNSEACIKQGISLKHGAPYGYHTPVETWVRVLSPIQRKVEAQEGNQGSARETLTLRLPAFPVPGKDHVLVNTTTDQRYVLLGSLNVFAYKGIAILAVEGEAELIPRTDPRYRLTLR